MRRVAGEPVLTRLDCGGERALEEGQSRPGIARRAAQSAPLEVDADADARILLRDLVQQPIAGGVVLAEPLHPGKLRQRLGPQGAKARLGRVEIVEVPEWSERVGHRPVVEKC